MYPDRFEGIRRINHLTSEMESLYHQASLKLGISDSVSIVLYTIYLAGGVCLLSDIYKKSGVSKQTVNSAMRALESSGIVRLTRHTGRSKKAELTGAGQSYARQTVARLYAAEVEAFGAWTRQEIETYIGLMEKYANCLREQIEKI